MALGTLKLAQRAVNLADCTKADVICTDVTDCQPGPPCGPCRLPRLVNVDVEFLGFAGSIVVDTNNFFLQETFIAIPGPGYTLCNGTVADGWYLQALIWCRPCLGTPLPPPGLDVFIFVTWRNGFEGLPAPNNRCDAFAPGAQFRCCGGAHIATCAPYDAPDFDACARPFFLDVTVGPAVLGPAILDFFSCGYAVSPNPNKCDGMPGGHTLRVVLTEA